MFTLLLAAGLRLAPVEVWTALRDWRRLVMLLAVNFIVVPAITVLAVRLFAVPPALALAMVLLSVAPFAPVVPVFTRLAQGDLALAAGLTAVFPVFCTFLTPLAYRAAMFFLPPAGELKFQTLSILATLLATATAPLALGVALNQLFPETSRRVVRWAEIVSEGVGSLSLAFVVISEFRSIFAVGWMPVLAMILLNQLSLELGYRLGGPDRAAKMVTGLGTANRNIALSLLVAADSFPATAVVPGVVTNGLLLILLGLVHVAWWRFGPSRRQRN
ncbi:MAG TPA: bile acid transporter [Verrucomicrobiales bacterium]|nr:bile acid transporter [Verrucomicrobiales bacterium]